MTEKMYINENGVEREMTKQEIAEFMDFIEKHKPTERDIIINELRELDSILPRLQEDIISATGIEVFGETKEVYERKKELRQKL